jgi:hypothetical protein
MQYIYALLCTGSGSEKFREGSAIIPVIPWMHVSLPVKTPFLVGLVGLQALADAGVWL